MNHAPTRAPQRARIKTIEKDPTGGWIARDPFDGQIILGDDFRWNSRASARDVVWQARILPRTKKEHHA